MSFPPVESEFAFELATCAWAEHVWPPEVADKPALVARQLGWQKRRWDTIVLEVDPPALAARLEFGSDALDSDLRHVLKNAPAEWQYYRDVLPYPGYPWRYVREAIHEADDREVLEVRKQSGRIEIKRQAPYPDWVERIVAIENKPDLDASAARRLQGQLERDVAASIADEVWLATEQTGDPVAPALLERIPAEVGILALGESGAEVLWQPRTLTSQEPGIEILDRPAGGDHDQSAASFEVIDVAKKAEKRLDIAERALERGWRSFVETMRADCVHFDLDRGRYGYQPICNAFGRHQTPSECGSACAEFQPEPPGQRSKGWPVTGGAGRCVAGVLKDQRERRRQSVSRICTSERGTESR